MADKDPGSLMVLVFDGPLKSREAFLAFQRLVTEEVVVLHDAVFIDKDAQGNAAVTETVDTTESEGAMRGGFWGALLGTFVAGPIGTVVGGAISAGLGAIAAKLIDIGVPDATVKEIEASLGPSSSALALLVSHVNEEGLARELTRFSGAKLLQSTLTPDAVRRFREALATATAGG